MRISNEAQFDTTVGSGGTEKEILILREKEHMTARVGLYLNDLQVVSIAFQFVLDILEPVLTLEEHRQPPVEGLDPDIALTVLNHRLDLPRRLVGFRREESRVVLEVQSVETADAIPRAEPHESVAGAYHTAHDAIGKSVVDGIVLHDGIAGGDRCGSTADDVPSPVYGKQRKDGEHYQQWF